MSLIGSLEDLSLGDILQIISLSQKSGVLALRTNDGDGRIVFRAGLVCGAVVKDGSTDLRGALVTGGFVAAADYDAAAAGASSSEEVAAALIDADRISAERLDSLRREVVEASVVTMFRWRVGDFSFDVREEREPEDPELLLPIGVNAQYLAMEGARCADEGGAAAQDDEAFDQMSAAEMFGTAPESSSDGEAPPLIALDDVGVQQPVTAALSESVELEIPPSPDPLGGDLDQAVSPPEGPSAGVGALSASLPVGPQVAESVVPADPASPQLRSGLGDVFDTLAQAVLEQHAPAVGFDSVAEHSEVGGLGEVAEFVAPAREIDAGPETAQGSDSRVGAEPDRAGDSTGHANQDFAGDSNAMGETVPTIERSVEPEALPVGPVTASDGVPPVAEVVAVFDPTRPVIVIDADLPALEWTRDVLTSQCERVHIFQRSDLGLTRIRQYLARAVAPIVLLSPATPGDRLSGIRDAVDFVRRLKQQAPMTRVIWLQEDGVVAVAEPGPADAIATRPASHRLRAAGSADRQGTAECALRDLVLRLGTDRPVPEAASPSLPGDALKGLKLATAQLQDASRRGEVLSVVLDYASKLFRRVAMLMIRDGSAIGIAQHDLAICGGPDDDGLRRFEMAVADSEWLTRVISERKAICGPPEGSGDLRLVEALGDRAPTAAYLAPIESSGRVVAIVYGDDLPGGGAPADMSAFEVVLHHAGLALDRAVLERALSAEATD